MGKNCENKAVAILNRTQAGKKALIKKDVGELLIPIMLDKLLAEAEALVQDSDALSHRSFKTSTITESLRRCQPKVPLWLS